MPAVTGKNAGKKTQVSQKIPLSLKYRNLITRMKEYTARFVLACVAILGFATCKKAYNNPNPDTYTITLATPVQNGNLVTLHWSKLNNDSLMDYVVEKVVDTTDWVTEHNPVRIIVSKDSTQFTDTLALMPYVQYCVVGETAKTGYASNKVIYSRTDINFMNIYPTSALIDHTTQLLYITGANEGNDAAIAVYDLQHGKQVATVTFGAAGIGGCDLGTYNGTRELYVPSEDGDLSIYNAATLALIIHISVGGELHGVVCTGNILYVTGEAASGGDYTYVYNRGTQALISQSSTVSNISLQQIPGTNSSFYAVSDGFNDYLYKYDNNGNLLYQKTGYPGNGIMNPGLFEVFPNGSGFISGNGNIFNDSLAVAGTMPHGSLSYNSICFDSTGQWIYAATTANTIVKYSAGSYNVAASYHTQGTPAKIFYYNGGILSVSYYEYTNGTPGVAETYSFIEQF